MGIFARKNCLLIRGTATVLAASLIWAAPGFDFYSTWAQEIPKGTSFPLEKIQTEGPASNSLPAWEIQTAPVTESRDMIVPLALPKSLEVYPPNSEIPRPEKHLFRASPVEPSAILPSEHSSISPHQREPADTQLQRAAERADAPKPRSESLEQDSNKQAEAFAGTSGRQAAAFDAVPIPAGISNRIEYLRNKLNKSTKFGVPGNVPPAPPQKPPSNQNPGSGGSSKRAALLAAAGLAGWLIFSGPFRYNPVISTLSMTGYVFGNVVGVFFPFPQVATTYKAQDAANVSLPANLIPGIGALFLTLIAYYMESPLRFLAAQNLFELFTFATVLGLKGYYSYKQTKGSPDRPGSWFQKLSSRTVERYNAFAEKLENKIRSSKSAMKFAYKFFETIFTLASPFSASYYRRTLENNSHYIEGKANTALEKLVSAPLQYRLTSEGAAVWLKTIPTMVLITALTCVTTFIFLPRAAPILQPWVRAHAMGLTIAAAALFGGFSLVSATKIERTKSSANVSALPSWLFGSASIGLGIFSVQKIMILRALGKDYSFPFIYLLLNIAGMATAVLNLVTINKYDPQGADPHYRQKFFRILKQGAVATAVAAFVILNSSTLLNGISDALFKGGFFLHPVGWKVLWEAPAAGAATWLLGALSWSMGKLIRPLPGKFAGWLDILIPWLNTKFPRLGLEERQLDFEQRLEFYKEHFGVHEFIRVDHGGQPLQRAMEVLSRRLLSGDRHPHVQVLSWDIKGQPRQIELTEAILEEVRHKKWLVGLGGNGIDLDNLADEADRREGRNPLQIEPHHFGEAGFSEIYLIPVRNPNQNKDIRNRDSILKLSRNFKTGLSAPAYA